MDYYERLEANMVEAPDVNSGEDGFDPRTVSFTFWQKNITEGRR